MTKRTRLTLTMALALTVFACMAGTAAAGTLTFRPGGEITWAGRLTFGEGAPQFSCNVSLRGTLAGTVRTTAGERAGSITAGRFEGCSGEGELVEYLLPAPITWQQNLLRSEQLVGILFRITSLGLLVEYPGLASNCLYGTTWGVLAQVELRTIRTTNILSPLQLFRTLFGPFCSEQLPVIGTLSMTPTQEVTLS